MLPRGHDLALRITPNPMQHLKQIIVCCVLLSDDGKREIYLPKVLHRLAQPQVLQAVGEFCRLGMIR